MPYVNNEKRVIDKELNAVQDVGQLNYVITLVLLAAWKGGESYGTIHNLRKEFVTEPKNSRFLNDLRSKLCDRFTTADIYTAAAEAFLEFRMRVGKLYEASKILSNGDLPQYEEALTALAQRYNELRKEKEAEKIIVPTSPLIK